MDRSSVEKERFTKSKRPPYLPEFHSRMIALVRSGRSAEDRAKAFAPSGQLQINGVAQSVDDGVNLVISPPRLSPLGGDGGAHDLASP